jgi:NAD+ kinase
MRIAVFGNIYRSVLVSHVELLFEYFKAKDVTLLLDRELHGFISEHGKCCMDGTEVILDDDFEADLALSIGGDGTFLNTAARIGRKQIPILGINTESNESRSYIVVINGEASFVEKKNFKDIYINKAK